MKFPCLFALFVAATACFGAPAQVNRWEIAADGGIVWTPKHGDVHADNIEMSGQMTSVIVSYGIDAAGHFTASRHVVWPMLRFEPNATRDQLALDFGEEAQPRLFVNRAALRNESITRVRLDGLLQVAGTYGRQHELSFTRTLFPSVLRPVVFDQTVLTNNSKADVVLEVEPNERTVTTNPGRGIYGGYIATSRILGAGERTLHPGESASFTVMISARKVAESPFVDAASAAGGDLAPTAPGTWSPNGIPVDVAAEEKARRERVAAVRDELVLGTPDRVLDTAFAFAKIRATESIFKTKSGLLHSPGGGEYYAAVWANDQAEYSGPFFGMLGDPTAREAALNAYRLFATYMNPEYRPIPSSIISEGANTWHGAGDRGDMAMISYGASRYALARGDPAIAKELWPLIEWCLEYCRRKVTADGVVASDADELENRFPSGKANLCTSSLYYDALNSAAYLATELGQPASVATDYRARAAALRVAIDKYFGAKVEGFDTYRYFDKSVPSVNPRALQRHQHYADEPDHLRAWICVPLTVGIFDRAPATIDALFSPRLWTADGLATEAGQETFWDRATLYALRGVFAAGETQRALDFLTYYSTRRLLGEHVPYPVEAYPEGNQRHLSAESALYCRIYTEGMFGIRPVGLHAFQLTPRLPKDWPAISLRNVHAFGGTFSLAITRDGEKLKVELTRDGQPPITEEIADGATTTLTL